MSENVNHTIEEVLENAKKSNRRADLKLIRRNRKRPRQPQNDRRQYREKTKQIINRKEV